MYFLKDISPFHIPQKTSVSETTLRIRASAHGMSPDFIEHYLSDFLILLHEKHHTTSVFCNYGDNVYCIIQNIFNVIVVRIILSMSSLLVESK